GVGYGPEGGHINDAHGIRTDHTADPHLFELLRVGVLCNSAVLDEAANAVGQPTEVALLSVAFKAGMPDLRRRYKRLAEEPFDPTKKLMTITYEIPHSAFPPGLSSSSSSSVISPAPAS